MSQIDATAVLQALGLTGAQSAATASPWTNVLGTTYERNQVHAQARQRRARAYAKFVLAGRTGEDPEASKPPFVSVNSLREFKALVEHYLAHPDLLAQAPTGSREARRQAAEAERAELLKQLSALKAG